jgi:hypothetical protein
MIINAIVPIKKFFKNCPFSRGLQDKWLNFSSDIKMLQSLIKSIR